MLKNPEKVNVSYSECAWCGFRWEKGHNGTHSCDEWMRQKIVRITKDYTHERRTIELLIAGGFVTREKVEEARQLLKGAS